MAKRNLIMSFMDIITENPEAIRSFLNVAGSTIVVVTDENYMIGACNDNLPRNLHLPSRPLGRFLGDILCPIEDEAFSLLISRQANSLLPQIFKVCYTDILYKCYTFATDNGFLLLGDRLGGTDNEVLESMSLLNNELSGLSRELAKKNRELEKAHQKIVELSRVDSLTGLANRRYFQERYTEMFNLCMRHKTSLSVAMIDLDHFKHINDAYGHDAGDTVLKEFAVLLKSMCRQEDFAARFGGEEFIMFLPHATAKEALAAGDRLRHALVNKDILKNRQKVTASVGIACIANEDQPEDLIKRADQALYAAKEAGRNMTCVI
jgi:diguanylate cyclase (GGDEF)-like protein